MTMRFSLVKVADAAILRFSRSASRCCSPRRASVTMAATSTNRIARQTWPGARFFHEITMNRMLFALLLLPWSTVPGWSQDAPLPPRVAAMKMSLPDGFKATLFAGEPDVVQPIAFAFDDRGRLWVAECMSYPNWQPDP